MKKSILFFLLALSFSFSINKVSAQTASTTIVYTGFQGCGGCAVCGADYYCFNTLSSYCGNTAACGTKTFPDPVPAGNIVTSVAVSFYSADCSGGTLTATLDGNVVPTVNEGNTGCACSNNPCGISASSSSNFPCGLPGYVYGGTNSLQLCTGANVCINKLTLTFTYAPANQATPALQPTVVNGPNIVCVGAVQTYSCPAVSNAASYNWTVPAGWVINSGQGTNVITATPGTAGNVCVQAQNLCGNSAYTCLAVTLSSPSIPAASASANPNPVCGTTTTTLSLSGGSLGAGASWQWYSGSCGGTPVGTGTSITVSPSSTTTYYVAAVGTCNTTSCASVVFTVNPVPTANAGSGAVLTCANTSTALAGSGGGSYSWSGPGIVSGGTTSSPTINQPGTYSLIVTVSGCPSAVSTVAVTQNTTAPGVTIATPGVLSCTTTNLNLSGGPGGGVTYSWSGPGIVSGGTTATPNINQPGTYGLTVTNPANGCTSFSTTTVTQNVSPPVASSSTTGTLTCGTVNVNVIISTATSPVSYNWSGPGIIAGAGTATITVNQGGTYNYTVTNTSNGCQLTGSQAVAQNTTAPVVTPASGTITCAATTVNASATTAASPVSYNWSGAGIVSGQGTGTITVNQGGTYNYTVTNTSNGCSTVSSLVVPTNTTAPTVTVSPASFTTSCATPTVTLTANSTTSGLTYAWTTSGGSLSSTNIANPVATGGGTYSVTVTNPVNGCQSSGTATVVPDASAPTATISASTATLTCSAPVCSATVTATPPSNLTYSWSPTPASGLNSASATFNASGTYVCTITNTVNACTASAQITVSTNTTAPSVSAAPSQTLTCATPTTAINTTVTPAAGITYTWSGAGITSGQGTGTISVNQGGAYSYTITDTGNGCSTVSSIAVPTNTTAPTVTVSPASYTTSCANPSVTLTANSTTSGLTYTWTNTGGSVSNANIANPVATGGGTYSVTVTDPTNGCQSSATATVVPDASAPTATISATTATLTCSTSVCSATVTATPPANLTYSWSPSPASGLNSASATFTTSGTYVCTVTNTVNACTAYAQIAVSTDTAAPSVSVTPSQTLTCASPTAAINTTVTPSAGITYTWSGSGIVGSATGAGINVNQADTYTVIVTNSVNGCTNTATCNVISNISNPTATISVVSSNSVISCTNPTVSLGVTSTPAAGVSYTWTPGGANTSTINATSAGIVSVMVLNTATGCSVTTQYTVTGNTTPPSVTAPAAVIPCGANSATISASSTNTNVTYSWTTANGSILSGSNTATPSVGSAGDYIVTVTDNSNGCSSTGTVAVTQSSVTAAFTANPSTGVVPLPVNFTNQSTGATSYTWTFGNASGSTSPNPSTTYTTNGTYTVMLVAIAGTCADTAYAMIVVEDDLSLEIPNVFTPNGDNINDVFTIKSTGVKEISLQIFNRWGERLYEFTGPSAAWDGKTGPGTKVPDGTYFFFAKATGFNDKTIEKQGTVNLYR